MIAPALTVWLVLAVGVASALAYCWKRQWGDAALVVLAGAALAGMLHGFTFGQSDAPATKIEGDGLWAAQWHDAPARPITWSAPATPVLRLDFPRQITLGRMFTLTLRRSAAAPGRLQLLAENKQVIAEASGGAADISVQWLPPVAESLLLRARLLDAAGMVVAEGPVPLIVRAAAPLQVQGRLAAPSFDARVLNELLAGSNALIDWQVTLGKTVTRSETAREAMPEPQLRVIDAAWFEQLNPSARGALLTEVAQGAPLIILAANARNTGLWSKSVGLALKSEAQNSKTGAPLAMTAAPFNPGSKVAGAWSGSGAKIWRRNWEKGSIVWVGVSDWHRYAISEPRALAMWWQGVIDQAGVRKLEDVQWLAPAEMPLPGQRLEVCALGVRGEVSIPALGQKLAWQRRPDKADAACVAVWPQAPGWLKLQTQRAKLEVGEVYVFAHGDWPLWQRAQRRDATARHMARTPQPAVKPTLPLKVWPFALLAALALLALWWRERR
ncbi:hypothetical protein [Massilia glaciei]|uniref:hypothetical protein n=1 Tax=Massilia glaciei TaxID=1524097 RepID=UPI0015E7FCC4|nr:hypothetical protein [Massilia glaciei]